MEKKLNLILPFVFAMMVIPVCAQTTLNQRVYYSFEQLENRNGWLNSQNAAGLATYDQDDFTQAEVKSRITKGDLHQVYDPSRSIDYQLDIRSYQRINQIMLYGRFVFDYDIKKNQNWSSMTYPGSSPLHIADMTPGTQTKETYFVDGGIGVPLGGNWTAGGAFDFEGVTNAKKKDIRNKNSFSRYHLSPSLTWESGQIRLGASYTYGSEVEEIEWTTYGDKNQHEVFFFQGLWFGPSEITSSSITGRRFERSMNRGALQLEYFTPRIRLFNQLQLQQEEQKAYLVIEQERGGENKKATYRYNGQLWLTQKRFDHSLKWSASHDFLKNYQNLQQREMINHIYQYVQYGTLLRYTESNWEGRLSYELVRKRQNDDWNRSWSFHSDLGFQSRQQRYCAYPSVFRQDIKRMYGLAGFEKNLLMRTGMIDLGLDMHYSAGWGTPVDPQAQDLNGHHYREDLQQQEYAYLTAHVLGGKLHAKYSWFFDREEGRSVFAKAAYNYQRSTASAMKDHKRTFAEITLGLNF